MTIVEFTDNVLHLSLSPAQRMILKSFYAEPLTIEESAIFEQCAGRVYVPRENSELTVVGGARGGKDSRLATPIALYEAFCRDHSSYLHPGERAYVLVIAQDSRGGQICFEYMKAAIEASDALNSRVMETRKSEIELDNSVIIAVYPCSYRSPKGITIACGIADEISAWRDETAANPDVEILRSIRRGMANTPHGKLIKISTPFGKSGVLYDDFTRRQELTDCLVFQAPTWILNPSISRRFLDREREKDPVAYQREFGAEFSDDIQGYVQREAVTACVVSGRFELPYDHRFTYTAFVDPAGGGGQDSYGMAIGHVHRKEGGSGNRFVLDLIREARPPFSPDAITGEFSQILKKYNIRTVIGDAYGGQFPREAYQRHGIGYTVSDLHRSDLYLELLPLLHSGVVELLDIPRMINQICNLQRKTATGKDRIDHMQGAHDDISNVVAGVLVSAALKPIGSSKGGIF